MNPFQPQLTEQQLQMLRMAGLRQDGQPQMSPQMGQPQMSPVNVPAAQPPPPQGIQDDIGAALSRQDLMSLQDTRNAPISGMDTIQKAKAVSGGTALAQAMAALGSNYMGSKYNKKQEGKLKKSLQKVADKDEGIRVAAEERQTGLDELNRDFVEAKIGEIENKPKAPPKHRVRDATEEDGTVVKYFEEWNPATQKYEIVSKAARKTGPDTVVNVGGDASEAFGKKFGEEDAIRYFETEKAGESAYRGRQAIDRFMAASADGRQGGAAPLISDVQNFLVSFGFDAEGLTEVGQMDQAIADILERKMEQLGARGLTDEDMKILRQALPQMGTSRESRENVARIMRKTQDYEIDKYIDRYDELVNDEANKDLRVHKPIWLDDERSQYDLRREARKRGLL